jgi:hypothetical protein
MGDGSVTGMADASDATTRTPAMTNDPALTGVEDFIGLLAAAVLVALIARRIRVPYTVGLVVLGLAVGIVRPGAVVAISPSLVLAVLEAHAQPSAEARDGS